jgi:DNA-binding winged helix-turn-helix (wHTH) protein
VIRIAIFDHNTYPLNNIVSSLQQADFATTAELDGENLSAWLAKHGVDILALHLPNENERPRVTVSNTKPEMLGRNGQACWQLNASQLELITPDGKPIPLSHNECCILGAAANMNGNMVSRKMLIEALGQDFWYYDERRLESLISRLRRKLASYAPEGFPIRGVKGQGYLFKIQLQTFEAWR